MATDPFYAVIFDAGSTGTRPFIYHITPRVVNGDGDVIQIAQIVEIVNHDGKSFEKSSIGIHEEGVIVADYLGPLFDDVQGTLERLGANPPAGLAADLPVKYYLYATGGVRDGLSPAGKEYLRERVANYMRTRGIAEVDYEYEPISGTDEAKYGWVAAHRSLGLDYNAGYVEMGGATAQIAFPLPDNDNVRAEAEGIAAVLNLVRVEDVGHQNLFLASYPLGSDAGFVEYERALFNRGEFYGLNGGGGDNIFFDPSRRQGSPDKEVEGNIIRFRPAGDLAGAESNPAKLMNLTGDAVAELFPGAAITQPLDGVLRQLSFIGASNFWHTLGDATINGAGVTFATLNQVLRDNMQKSHATMNDELDAIQSAEKRASMRPIYEKSIFTTQWTLRVLRQAFGIPLDHGATMTFTPYNGSGDNHNRFSWTLGTAVLLASPAPTDLAAAVPVIRAPAPPQVVEEEE